ncbi:ladderlectin-like [Kryptolebias marmoratus]|uniref:ladderlectin-like n=1 Tax=Kryptolebias marmoratus TaxID=37003 RepID=UPI0007F896D5|nr:ladderlectin-like [Kryptolebias marmoratus]
MKILTLPLFLCAFLALSQAAAFPDNEDELVKEETDLIVLPEAEALNWTHPAGDELGTEENVLKATNDLIRRGSCSHGWREFNGRCFRYFPISISWANAQRNCVSMQASLASVHSFEEYHFNYCVRYQNGNLPSVHSAAEYRWLQSYVYSKTRQYPLIWLGGSDSEQERFWFWSDGSRLSYSNWCSGSPRTSTNLNCIIMNASSRRCWYDYLCGNQYAFVCAKKAK